MNIYNLLSGEITQKDLLNYYNATIIYEELPISINGLVFNYDNVYFILVNKSLSYHDKKKTILHELAHIELNHLCQYDKELFSMKIDEYEDEADEYMNFLINNYNEVNKELKKYSKVDIKI